MPVITIYPLLKTSVNGKEAWMSGTSKPGTNYKINVPDAVFTEIEHMMTENDNKTQK